MPRARPPFWLNAPSRFAGLGRRAAALVAVLLALLAVASLINRPAAPAPAPPPPQLTDLMLYDGVIDGLRAGGDYYQLTADALRTGGYPLRPFITFRLPLHSVVQAAIPRAATLLLQYALAIGVIAAWWARLRPAFARAAPRLAVALLLLGGMIVFVQADLAGFHEVWAAQLVALALALRRAERWTAPVALALVAMLVRETAALFVLVMALAAWRERLRGEALGWGLALVAFAVVLAAHAYGVAQVTGPLDPASPGWNGLLGFGFFAGTVARATALELLPTAIAAPLVALALFGWASWRDPLGVRATAVFAAYALAISVFARADTFYWGLMVAPVLLAGLAFAPDGLRDIGHALLDRRRVRVQRIAS